MQASLPRRRAQVASGHAHATRRPQRPPQGRAYLVRVRVRIRARVRVRARARARARIRVRVRVRVRVGARLG